MSSRTKEFDILTAYLSAKYSVDVEIRDSCSYFGKEIVLTYPYWEDGKMYYKEVVQLIEGLDKAIEWVNNKDEEIRKALSLK